MDLQTLSESFIGKTEKEGQDLAAFNGYKSRTRVKDGVPRIGTADFRMDRINFIVEDGKITEANFG